MNSELFGKRMREAVHRASVASGYKGVEAIKMKIAELLDRSTRTVESMMSGTSVPKKSTDAVQRSKAFFHS